LFGIESGLALLMATIKRVEDFEIWQLARQYAKEIRLLLRADEFQFEFGLKEQLKNSSGSVMDNIAEGFGRGSKNEFVNHLTIAKGSAEESKSQLYRCFDDGLIDEKEHERLVKHAETIIKKTAALMNYLNQVSIKGQKFKDRI
jgi:four helix bundle protein